MTLGTRPRQRLTLAVACMAQGMMVLDVLIVSVALPAMQRELHLSPAGLEWIVSGYALALAALIPTGGALGDHFGRKRIFVSGVTLFTLASVGCALSVSGAMLVGFRVIQGIGGAVMSSLTTGSIQSLYIAPTRPKCSRKLNAAMIVRLQSIWLATPPLTESGSCGRGCTGGGATNWKRNVISPMTIFPRASSVRPVRKAKGKVCKPSSGRPSCARPSEPKAIVAFLRGDHQVLARARPAPPGTADTSLAPAGRRVIFKVISDVSTG